MKNLISLRWVLILALGMMASSCATIPITGRKQFRIVTNQEMLAYSYQSYRETIRSSQLSRDYEAVAMIERVGNRIVEAAERLLSQENAMHLMDGFDWEFKLIESSTVNAFCMPGGKVAFYTGILPYCENEEGIAAVMGHEVAHAIAWHSAEQLSNQSIFKALIGLIGSLFSPSATVQDLEYIGVDLASLAFSRSHESEADHMGLIFMAAAGYNPEEAPKFWERMNAAAGSNDFDLLSTHPSNSKRIRNLEKLMPKALQYYNPPLP